MPERPMISRRRSHSSRCCCARKFDGAVIGVCKMMPQAPGRAARLTLSMSSVLVPTLPIWGKVKVTICPA
jgi:hypothetical protein